MTRLFPLLIHIHILVLGPTRGGAFTPATPLRTHRPLAKSNPRVNDADGLNTFRGWTTLASTSDDREYVPIRREKRGRSQSEADESRQDESDDYYSRGTSTERLEDDDNDDDWDYMDGRFDDDEEDEEYDLFENVLIPNPLLDSMDPDGAAERFPELARDPRFWFDMVLFIAFLDFLSYAGPRDPFPDLPMYFPGV